MFPAKSWPQMHVWIGVCFGGIFQGMLRGMFRGMFRSAELLTKRTLWGYVWRYVSEGSNMRPFIIPDAPFSKQPYSPM